MSALERELAEALKFLLRYVAEASREPLPEAMLTQMRELIARAEGRAG